MEGPKANTDVRMCYKSLAISLRRCSSHQNERSGSSCPMKMVALINLVLKQLSPPSQRKKKIKDPFLSILLKAGRM
jgi:hypothetical protein